MGCCGAGEKVKGEAAKPGPGKAAPAKATAKPADPRASALLAEVARAYKSLGSYSDQGEFVMNLNLGGKPQLKSLERAAGRRIVGAHPHQLIEQVDIDVAKHVPHESGRRRGRMHGHIVGPDAIPSLGSVGKTLVGGSA